MSEDINFLPKELRPHKKEAPKKDEGIALSEPLRDSRPLSEKTPLVKKHWWQNLAYAGRRKQKNTSASQPSGKLRDDRKNLLAHIQYADTRPTHVHKVEKKASKPSFFVGLHTWLSRPRKPKAPLPEKNLPQPQKIPQPAPVVKLDNPEYKVSPQPAAQPVIPAPIAQKPAPRPRFHQAFVGTNLLKGQEFLFFNWRKLAGINIISIAVTLMVVAGAWWYALQVKQNQGVYVSPLQIQLESAQTSFAALTEQAAAMAPLRRKAQLIQSLLDTHSYWTNFFTYLENNTLPSVYYLGFAGDLSGEYTLKGRARDFAGFVAQAQAWQQEPRYTQAATAQSMQAVSEQQLRGETAQSVNVVEFDLGLLVDKTIFYK